MIVRDEAAVIGRCIESVRDLISSWVIVDTGSVDATCSILEAALRGIPGQLYERPWRDFGANRSELMALAAGAADYLLLMDADMTLVRHGALPPLTEDGYLMAYEGALAYAVPRLVRGDLPWRYVGATHEYLTADEPFQLAALSSLTVEHHGDGGSRGDKLTRDRNLLEAQLAELPDDPRTVFYLAQTYRDLGESRLATELYRLRVALGGWAEEQFYAALQAGMLVADRDFEAGVELLVDAWELRPQRSEPLYEIAVRARTLGAFDVAEWATSLGVDCPVPTDILFVHRWVYQWGMRLERSIACAHTARLDEAWALTEELLGERGLPEDVVEALRANAAWLEARRTGQSGTWSGPSARIPTIGHLCAGAQVTAMPAIATGGPWSQTNPSIANDQDRFLAVVRSVNYELDGGEYRIADPDGVVRTVNSLVALDRELAVVAQTTLEEPARPARHRTGVAGFEDCRLFSWRNRWWATATSRDLDGHGRCRQVLLSIAAPAVEVAAVLEGPDPMRHEKNWMPFVVGDGLCFVYACRPFTVLWWDPVAGRPREILRTKTDHRFAGLRGGSQGLPVDDGYLFVVHEVRRSSTVRHYAHRFISVDGSLRPTGISRPFVFLHAGIEFCAGIARRGEEVVLSFGIDDRQGATAVLPLDAIIDVLEPLGSAPRGVS